jgi:hypothetical protein
VPTKHSRVKGPGCFLIGMDRIWQSAWDRYKSRYSWACWALTLPLALPVYLAWSLGIVAFERSDRYPEAAAVTVVAVLARRKGSPPH